VKYAVEMGAGSIRTKFHKACWSHAEVDRRNTQSGDCISPLLFLQNEKNSVKRD
jgi:hypothetical protein